MNKYLWTKKQARLWLSSGEWSELRTVYEYHVPVRGLTLWAHRPLIKVGESTLWVISEASSGLRINTDGKESRTTALEDTIEKMKPYTDEYLAEKVKCEVVKHVTQQIQESGKK